MVHLVYFVYNDHTHEVVFEFKRRYNQRGLGGETKHGI